MTPTFGTLTIGANPVQIPWTSTLGVAKLILQVAPGATGTVKVGGSAALTSDAATPGLWLSPNSDSTKPGDSIAFEANKDHDTVYPNQYWIHGSHAGDKVNYAIHVN